MSKLSLRMRALKGQGSRVPDKRDRSDGVTNRQPIVEDAGWPMSSLPSPHPQPRAIHNLLFLCLAVVIIIVMNFVFWGTGSEQGGIDPATGRQINQSEPWD